MVVATHNRAHLLERLCTALRAQTGVESFEVLLVDDGSTDETPAVIDRVEQSWPAVKSIRLAHNCGPAAARNEGWRASGAPIIAFTDDDCVPQPTWLAALVRAAEHADIAQGMTIGNPTQSRDGWFAWSPETLAADGTFETCNIAYRRSALESVGGFDETYGARAKPSQKLGRYVAPRWGEDTDLALRVLANGATAAFTAHAIVWHDVKPGGLLDRLRDLPRRGGLVATVKRHPELRRNFDWPWCTDRAHAYVLVAAAGGAGVIANPCDPRRWGVAIALAAPWVRVRGAQYPRSAWSRVLPQWLLVDLADAGVMAIASIRERTLLL